ncbi:Aspartate--tRNA ligase 2 [Nymphaea thermarum]|nr:Aspartate--tRNA ligase 2 [Nymphaea thermarum]
MESEIQEGLANASLAEDKAVSKKAAKKEAAKAEKLKRQQEAAAAASAAAAAADEADPLAENYGDVPLEELQSKAITGRKWTKIGSLTAEMGGSEVWIRGQAQIIRAVSKNMAFVVLREMGFTVQCVLTVKPGEVSRQMVRFVSGLSRESFVDIFGVISVPGMAIKGASQQVEIQVRKVYCVNKAVPNLPINIEDAARSEVEIEQAEKSHWSWRRAFFVDRSSWKLPSLNAVEVPASVFRLQPIRAAVLLLGTPPPRDPCRCLGFRAITSGSMPPSPRDPCHCLGVCASGFMPLPRVLRHRLGIRALVLLPSPSPVSLVSLTCFPEKKEDMRA